MVREASLQITDAFDANLVLCTWQHPGVRTLNSERGIWRTIQVCGKERPPEETTTLKIWGDLLKESCKELKTPREKHSYESLWCTNLSSGIGAESARGLVRTKTPLRRPPMVQGSRSGLIWHERCSVERGRDSLPNSPPELDKTKADEGWMGEYDELRLRGRRGSRISYLMQYGLSSWSWCWIPPPLDRWPRSPAATFHGEGLCQRPDLNWHGFVVPGGRRAGGRICLAATLLATSGNRREHDSRARRDYYL